MKISCSVLVATLAAAALPRTAGAESPPEETVEVERPPPWIWVRQAVALAYAPLGLLSTTRVQAREALHRADSRLFQATYAGVGAQLAVSPAFVELGPRFSLAPVDMFDVDVQASWTFTWPSSSGLIPFSGLTGTLDSQRKANEDSSLQGSRFTISVSPTLKMKVGPVIGLWNTEWAFMHHMKPEGATSPFVYEALRDLVVAWDDVVVTNIAAVLVEILDGTGPQGGAGPVLRAGVITRDKQTAESRDISTSLGGAVTFRPGPKPGWPDIFVAVMGYLRDNDRALAAPNIQIQAAWTLERAVRPSPAAEVVAALR